MQRLMDAAETAKKELSNTVETDINLPFITADASGPKHLMVKLTRSKFESMIEPMVNQIIDHIVDALKQAKLTKNDIKEIVMVGGSTRIPLVKTKVSEFFGGKTLNNSVNPDEVVAGGAAIQAGVLKGDVNDVLLLDVLSLSMGIETLGGIMTTIIEKGTTIPTSKSETFSTAADNQPAVSVRIATGEANLFADNKMLGTFELGGIAPAPRGVPQIEITLDVDANGVLKVSAKDKATGKENSITITGSGTLSEAEINRLVAEAEESNIRNKGKLEIINARNKLDGLISQIEKFIKDNETVETSDLKKELERVKMIMNESSDDLQSIENAEKALTKKFQEVGQRIYSQEPHDSTVHAHPEQNTVDDENVVDAEFTEQ